MKNAAEVRRQSQFWRDPSDARSQVFVRFPPVFRDGRGFFCQALGGAPDPCWAGDPSWIRQVNRSSSKPGVARGMHAQSGRSCQGKFVQAVSGTVVDVITDARPDSPTFGVSDAFVLDSRLQNQLWVPRGFLHGFVVPPGAGQAVFEYFCDNEYDRAAEICVSPAEVVRKVLALKAESDPAFAFDASALELSEKDQAGAGYEAWMAETAREWESTGRRWYR